jgi:hypothetical protein
MRGWVPWLEMVTTYSSQNASRIHEPGPSEVMIVCNTITTGGCTVARLTGTSGGVPPCTVWYSSTPALSKTATRVVVFMCIRWTKVESGRFTCRPKPGPVP